MTAVVFMINLRAFFMASFYDLAMHNVEKRCLAQWRSELLSPLRGDVLEIGTGTGINLHYYSRRLNRLVLSEPDPHMRAKLRNRISGSAHEQAEVTGCSAEKFDYPDASFDHIVSTLVLCSVHDVDETLQELKRLLKPGGSLVFLEHVRAERDPALLKVQRKLEPIWKWCAGNCHLTRPTVQSLQQVGFETRLQQVEMKGAPFFVRPMIKGVAIRT